MEMGKLTAKLRDAVPVCLLVEGKEIKRYKNIEIPDELKMLEYQDFKFDVPLNGSITFKIMFEPGVLPEEFPHTRERRTRAPKSKLEPVVSEAPAIAQTEELIEATEETAAIIALQGEPVEKISESQAAGEKAGSTIEAQVSKEAKHEAQEEPTAKVAAPAKTPAAKPKKAPSKGSKK